MIEVITVQMVDHIALMLAREHKRWDEPVSVFQNRTKGVLERILNSVYKRRGEKEKYPSATEKAAVVFTGILLERPFDEGNRRIAVMTLLVLLEINGFELRVGEDKLHDLVRWVEDSPGERSEGVIETIAEYLDRNIVPKEPPDPMRRRFILPDESSQRELGHRGEEQTSRS